MRMLCACGQGTSGHRKGIIRSFVTSEALGSTMIEVDRSMLQDLRIHSLGRGPGLTASRGGRTLNINPICSLALPH